jgi:hypothetical protein
MLTAGSFIVHYLSTGATSTDNGSVAELTVTQTVVRSPPAVVLRLRSILFRRQLYQWLTAAVQCLLQVHLPVHFWSTGATGIDNGYYSGTYTVA